MTVLVYYTDTGGADTNSGTTSGTSPLANGTAATRSTNVYTLDGSPDLSGVTANQDTIHIVGETSGRGADGTLFEITAVDDGADTVTVDPTPTGGTSGLTWAIGGAFATIDKAMSVVAAGDKVWVKASGNYNETVTMDTVGTTALGIVFEGYTTTPGDNGKITIDGQSTRSNCVTSSLAAAYYTYKNFIFTGATATGANIGNTDSCTFFNCEFNNNGAHGFSGDNVHRFVNCIAANNSSKGIDCDNNTRFFGCIGYGNGQEQFFCLTCDGFIGNLAYGHTSGIDAAVSLGNVFSPVCNNTIDGENVSGADGISMTSETTPDVFNNIIYDCDSGVVVSNAYQEAYAFMGFNLMNSNTQDYEESGIGAAAGPMIGVQDVTSAPAFTDEAGDDYTLGATSPAIDAGLQPGGLT